MYSFNNQYDTVVFHSHNSGDKHPLFENNPPLSVHEMYMRSLNGIPLSVPIPKSDKIPVNCNFFTDKFDSLDYVISQASRLSDEERERQKLENEKLKKEREEFEKWKLDQEKERLASLEPTK